MNNANHVAQDDLYLFALQLLPEAEMKSIGLHLKECPLCRAEVGQIQGDLVVYAMTAEMQGPPTQARERFLKQVAAEKKVIPINRSEPSTEPVMFPRNSRMFQMEAPEEREQRRVAPFLAWTGWAVAATAVVVAGMQFQQRKLVENNLVTETAQLDEVTAKTAQAQDLMRALTDTSAMQVSLHVPLTARQQPKLDPEAHATYVPRKGALVFVASHLDPLQMAKTYELWLLPADAGQAPIPAGLFKPDGNGNATVVMPVLPKGVIAKGFGVTVEDEGGSKTPTAPIVLAGL
jgi:anti-sigma-K factor RskA